MNKLRLSTLAIACCVLTGTAGELAGQKLLITSVRTGDTEIFIVDPETGDAFNASKSPKSEDRYPCWSPDGKQIAFTSDRNNSTNLYVMKADGSNVRQLTHSKSVCYMPSWAGNVIVLGMHGEKPEMARVNSDGSDLRMLGEGHDPCISRDGSKITYTGHVPGGVTVFRMKADGSDKRRVVTDRLNPHGAVYPYWSPDGEQIVYAQEVGEALEVFMVNEDGSNLRPLTKLGGINTPAAWSTDGAWISFRHTDDAYWRDREKTLKIYSEKPADKRPVWVAKVDGSQAHVVECLRFQCAIDGSRASWKPLH